MAASQRSEPRSIPGEPLPAQSQSIRPLRVSPVHRALPCQRSPWTKTAGSCGRDSRDALLGFDEEGVRGALAAEGGEVDAGDGAVALGEGGGRRQGDGVEGGGGPAEGPEAGRGAAGWDPAAARELLDQDQGRIAVQVGGEQPWRRDVVAGGELECRHLGGEGGGVLAGAGPQHHTAVLAVPGEPDQPGRAAVAEAADLGDVGAWGGGVDGPAERCGVGGGHGDGRPVSCCCRGGWCGGPGRRRLRRGGRPRAWPGCWRRSS